MAQSATMDSIRTGSRVPVIVSLPPAVRAEAVADSFDGPVQPLPLVNGFATSVPASGLVDFARRLPRGASVSANPHRPFPDASTDLAHAASEPVLTGAHVPRLQGIERVWAEGVKGQGQVIAVIDSGLHPHRDLEGRILEWRDFSDQASPVPVDTEGHGTHVAGIMAGNGASSAGKYQGVAPEAKVVACRIQSVSDAIRALQWIIENRERLGITVVNMSLGDCVTQSYRDDPWAQATQKAIDAGLPVVVAASNECCGPSDPTRCDLSISTPGNLPTAITVGALDDSGTPGTEDDHQASFSARGPTPIDGIAKPDVLAPGVSVVGPVAPSSRLDQPDRHVGRAYVAISGTSQATPMVAGLVALMRQVNPSLTPARILDILKRTSVGQVQADAAVAEARA